MDPARRITPVILSGGSGTRLWPLSRAARPKQLLAITGAETMLQQTALRVSDSSLFAAPIVVTGASHADMVDAQLAAQGRAPHALIVEPCSRNTAPAIALAALACDREDILLVLPSDHFVADEQAFSEAVARALPLAEEAWLVTFGIAAERPETGYGYIKRGRELRPGLFQVERFVEKPDAATAQAYCAEGCYDWNGGIFLFAAGAFLDALGEHASDVLSAAKGAMATAARESNRVAPAADSFAESPSVSIDYALMEKARRVAVAAVAMGWSDIGSWDALHELGDKDPKGNVVQGDALAIDSANCLVRSDGPLVITCGVEDLIVVASGDAVLVVPRGDSQRVREATQLLKQRGHPAAD